MIDIRAWRTRAKLSPAEAAALLGVSVRTLARWEAGTSRPSALALKQIASVIPAEYRTP